MHTHQRPLEVSIPLYTLPCPNGFVLKPIPEDSTHSSCVCNEEDNINIQNCKADKRLLLTVSYISHLLYYQYAVVNHTSLAGWSMGCEESGQWYKWGQADDIPLSTTLLSVSES